eukprot:TRINITY_DN45710_c0_g1_i1.p1 TRINITY_DN45710_c0_g1~~TRINITY_DN45710_c0_g1_i1.p1  ORF type:complete len:178 (-),score=40.16 TRINITY_DN45710_c0_g1_i1:29-505(-)
MAQTLQMLRLQRRLMANEGRRLAATRLVAEQQEPWWAALPEVEVRSVASRSGRAPDVDCHRVLGARPGASPAELKAAFLATVQPGGSSFVLARACYEFQASPQKQEERQHAEPPSFAAAPRRTWLERFLASWAARATPASGLTVAAVKGCPTVALSLV